MPSAFDIALDSNGDWPLIGRHITGLDFVLQRVAIRLGYVLGEWLLDSSKGIPFKRWFNEKPFDLERAGAEVRQQIETTPGVDRLVSFSQSFSNTAQTAAFTGSGVFAGVSLDFEVAPANVSSDLDTVNQSPALAMFFRAGHIVARF